MKHVRAEWLYVKVRRLRAPRRRRQASGDDGDARAANSTARTRGSKTLQAQRLRKPPGDADGRTRAANDTRRTRGSYTSKVRRLITQRPRKGPRDADGQHHSTYARKGHT